jgi:hypothetical protein
MRVKELMAKLATMPENAEVVTYNGVTEDGGDVAAVTAYASAIEADNDYYFKGDGFFTILQTLVRGPDGKGILKPTGGYEVTDHVGPVVVLS